MIRVIRNHRRPFWLSVLSLIALVSLMVSTNPIDKIIYAVVFFVLALVFLISSGYLLVAVQTGEVTPKNRYRIAALSLIILIVLMFRSAQSLNWVDGLILVLIGFGLVFYISRRG